MKISFVWWVVKILQAQNIRNKQRATGACSNTPGIETALLDFIHMFYAIRWFYSYPLLLTSAVWILRIKEKLQQGKHPINKNWEKTYRDACCSLWAHQQTAFSAFPVLYSILVRVMWFFTLLNVRGISTVAAHIQARIWRSVQPLLKQKLLEERQSTPTLTKSIS